MKSVKLMSVALAAAMALNGAIAQEARERSSSSSTGISITMPAFTAISIYNSSIANQLAECLPSPKDIFGITASFMTDGARHGNNMAIFTLPLAKSMLTSEDLAQEAARIFRENGIFKGQKEIQAAGDIFSILVAEPSEDPNFKSNLRKIMVRAGIPASTASAEAERLIHQAKADEILEAIAEKATAEEYKNQIKLTSEDPAHMMEFSVLTIGLSTIFSKNILQSQSKAQCAAFWKKIGANTDQKRFAAASAILGLYYMSEPIAGNVCFDLLRESRSMHPSCVLERYLGTTFAEPLVQRAAAKLKPGQTANNIGGIFTQALSEYIRNQDYKQALKDASYVAGSSNFSSGTTSFALSGYIDTTNEGRIQVGCNQDGCAVIKYGSTYFGHKKIAGNEYTIKVDKNFTASAKLVGSEIR